MKGGPLLRPFDAAVAGVSVAAVSVILLPILQMFAFTGVSGMEDAVRDHAAVASVLLSIEAAFYATLVGTMLGVPFGYLLSRRDFPGKGVVEGIVDLPIVIPHTVAGIALLLVLGRQGWVGAPLEHLGLRIAGTFPGIVAAMLFVSIPFIINAARDGFDAVDPRYENVAMGLGASRLRAVLTVTLPLALRGIVTGSVFAFARALSEFGAVVLIAYFPMTAPVYIYSVFNEGGIGGAVPVAALLLLVSLAVFVTARTLSRRWKVYA